MADMFWTAMAVMLVFVVFKVIETKMSSKEPQSAKHLIKDSILVYLSAIAALYLIDYLSKSAIKPIPQVALGEPSF